MGKKKIKQNIVIFNVCIIFVADGINSVGDYNSPPGGCRLYVCMYDLEKKYVTGLGICTIVSFISLKIIQKS